MVEAVQEAKCPSEEETKLAVEAFRRHMEDLREEYMQLIKHYKVTADFYIGSNLTQTYLPDEAKFKKTVVTRY